MSFDDNHFAYGTTELVILCKSSRRYFDLDAVRTPNVDNSTSGAEWKDTRSADVKKVEGWKGGGRHNAHNNRFGTPPLDWWRTDTPPQPPPKGTPMGSARYLVGDVFDVMATLPDASVDLVLSSPPFLALRSYLPSDHPDKGKEIGSEPTPAAFIDRLLDLTEEWARLLTPHGSICIELGDTYANDNGNRTSPQAAAFLAKQARTGTEANVRRLGDGWPEAKSLCLIPELYRIALVYGFNPLTGRTTPRWRARNVIRWCRPNPPVGALGDKMRPATSDMVVACKSAKRWFDLDAVRTDFTGHAGPSSGVKYVDGPDDDLARRSKLDRVNTHVGAPPLDHWWHDDFDQDAWLIPTEPYKGSHYATWPTDLLVKPIQAMCPRRVCVTCGKPTERIVGEAEYVNARTGEPVDKASWSDPEKLRQGAIGRDNGALRSVTTEGWSDCGHNTWRPGLILDPFAGSGTTLAVATGHGRDAIGIDLDSRNADLARERVGMFLTVEYPENVA